MKNTLTLTVMERTAWGAAATMIARLQNEQRAAQADAEAVVREIIAAHKAHPLKAGGTVTMTQVDGQWTLVYDAAEPGPSGNGSKNGNSDGSGSGEKPELRLVEAVPEPEEVPAPV